MFKTTNPAVIVPRREDVAECFRSFPRREGYAYSVIGRFEIHRLVEFIYCLEFDFSWRNNTGEQGLADGFVIRTPRVSLLARISLGLGQVVPVSRCGCAL